MVSRSADTALDPQRLARDPGRIPWLAGTCPTAEPVRRRSNELSCPAHIAGATAPPGSASAYSLKESTKANRPKTDQPVAKIHGQHLANHRLLS
jgi:hypothetical protein